MPPNVHQLAVIVSAFYLEQSRLWAVSKESLGNSTSSLSEKTAFNHR